MSFCKRLSLGLLLSFLCGVFVGALWFCSLPRAAADDSANEAVIKGEDLLNPFAGRTARGVAENVARHGGTKESEAAVARGLEWLAKKQAPDGSWSFDGGLQEAKTTATGLVLLPFLGAGQTHQQGKYKKTVAAGIKLLVQNLKESDAGGSTVDRGTMYGQGIATTALCEAYALTRDPALKNPAQLAINFIVHAQDPQGGGWRYAPKMPGDTSVTGWQIAALRTAAKGRIGRARGNHRQRRLILTKFKRPTAPITDILLPPMAPAPRPRDCSRGFIWVGTRKSRRSKRAWRC